VTIPNFITIARLLSVPLIVWLMIADRYMEAMLLFVAAGISDAADGFIAKRFGATSELGAYLDPLADKALLVSVFVTLGLKGALPPWLIILAVSRDILIIGGIILSYILGNPMEVKPLLVSKANTAAQIVLIALVLGDQSGANVVQPLLVGTVITVAGLTVASAAAYLVEWVRHMAGGAARPGEGGP
jgi:cardiolipin synthase